MPAARILVRKIKEVLRLKWERWLSQRQIAESCHLARSTVSEYLRRAQMAGLPWPLPEAMEDRQGEQVLFPLWVVLAALLASIVP